MKKHSFQAVIVRYMHDVLTGEFLNVGVVLLCPEKVFVGARFISQWSRVTAAFPGAEIPLLRRLASTVEEACAERAAHPLLVSVEQSIEAMFAQIIPKDDACIQLSPVLRGVTSDPERTLSELHERYTERYLADDAGRARRDETAVWASFADLLSSRGDFLHRLAPFTLRTDGYQYEFERAWRNGVWNVAQPLSLDMLTPVPIREKATSWLGRIAALRPSEHDAHILFLVARPPEDAPQALREAAHDAIQILEHNLKDEGELVFEEKSAALADKIARDLALSDAH